MGTISGFIFLLLLFTTAKGLEFAAGPEPVLNLTALSELDYILYMNENNHNFTDQTLLLTIKGDSESSVTIEGTATTFRNNLTKLDNNTYSFYALQSFDYETQPRSYTYFFRDSEDVFSVQINIQNIDDESPTLTAANCMFKENYIYDKINSTCNCTVSDPDGWLSEMTFTIPDSSVNSIFSFQYREEPTDTTYEALVYIVLNKTLDYEEITFYTFLVVAQDGAGHHTTPEEVRVIINVEDQNDMPPEWTNYFTTAQFEEEQAMTFYVVAMDGDKGINASIYYEMVEDEEEGCVSINNNGTISVKPIDRDARDIQRYQFTIMAIEEDVPPYVTDPPFNTSLTITFYIDDIDDNLPLVTSIAALNGTNNETFSEGDEKIINFNFDENFDGTLDANIAIRDIDTGENAQFTVKLEDISDDGILYAEAFMVVPSAGYRQGNFQVIVINSTKLDYEDPDWINIQFYVLSQGNNLTKQDNLLVNITLNDINDEYPIFSLSEYSIEVNETLEKDNFIIQVLATDRDAADKVLKHTLIGSQVITRLLNIDSASGNISVAIDNAFDYDTINPLFVQVRATDAVGHNATVPLTITLIDVNNKAPTISVETMIEVDENQPIGSILNTSITASDPDTTRNLTAQINWDISYATKNSRRLNMTNSTIRQEVEFLDLKYETSNTNGDITITLQVNDKNENSTTPDFELFDSLYLSITVTDLNTDPEFLNKQNTTALILISIGDLNDNAPEFTEETKAANRTVFEDADPGIIVGSILAIDADVGDTVTYDCIAQNDSFDWIVINTATGVFKVKENVTMSADIPVTYYFNYTCSASDDDMTHTTYLNVSIYILDRNNQVPQINMNSTLSVKEKSDVGTNVSKIGTSDLDRDIPFHTVNCEFEDRSSNCSTMFLITNNELQVRSNELNRDLGQAQYDCTIRCYDNPDNLQSQSQNENTAQFVIDLIDINDNPPVLKTDSLTVSENTSEDTILGIIFAEDIDEGDNAEIDFAIKSVTMDGDEEEADYLDLFSLETDEDYRTNKTFKQANLVAVKSLQGLYGSYVLNVNLTDRGSPPNTRFYDLKVAVTRYNFYSPRFVFPENGQSSFVLQAYQDVGQQLQLFRNRTMFDDIVATDNESDNCTDKWNMTFKVEQSQPDNVSIFSINTNGFDRCTARLQVNNNYDSTVVKDYTYQVTLYAILDEDKTPDEGEKPYITATNINFTFLDATTDPIFINSNTWEFSFLEANESETRSLEELAVYQNVPEAEQPPIYYYLKRADENVQNTFVVAEEDGTVSLQQELDYLIDQKFVFSILASRSREATSSNEKSYLAVTVNVIDINNHVPQWTAARFFGAIMSSYPRNTPILTVNATDLDEIDKDNLTYSIVENTLTTNGTGLDAVTTPFVIDKTTGEIKLNFQVDRVMTGYFKFNISVEDSPDGYGNGPHSNITDVTIYIITSDNTVNFRFENTLVQVVDNQESMLNTIGSVLGYDCYKQAIEKDTSDGVELDNQTVASLYFHDGSGIIKADDIQRQVSGINTFSTLRSALLKDGLLLMGFTSETETTSLEPMLKAWLIGVSVVLGAICVILLVTFILKTRELSRRIQSLTNNKFGSEESGLNRLGITAPTTNKHAVEGSNPVFNSEKVNSDLADYDKTSIQSGDSDLIGVEDNPEFDYFDINNKINRDYI